MLVGEVPLLWHSAASAGSAGSVGRASQGRELSVDLLRSLALLWSVLFEV